MKQIKTLLLTCLLLLSMVISKTTMAQAPPSVYKSILIGTHVLDNDTVSGPYKWYKWLSDTGVVRISAKLNKQGINYQLAKAELYTVSSGSLVLAYSDTLIEVGDSSLNLFAGLIAANTELYIKLINATGSCTACTVNNPLIQFKVENMQEPMSGIDVCDLISNGDFETKIPGAVCGSNTTTGVLANWIDYEATTDVYTRNCTIGGGVFNLGANTFNSTPILDSHSPSPNNTIVGQWCSVTPSLFPYQWNETIQTQLNTPLVNGRTYSISCWVYNLSGGLDGHVVNLQAKPTIVTFGVSPSIAFPPNTSNASYPQGVPNIISSFTTSTTNAWQQLSTTFAYTGANSSFLLVGQNRFLNQTAGNINATNQFLYIGLDDLSLVDITPIGISATQNHPNCSNNIATYTLTAGGSTNSYTWQPAGIITPINNPKIVVSPTVTTVYTVQSTNPLGCPTTTTYTVIVLPAPTGTIVASNATVCPSSAVTLSVNGTGYNPIMNIWTPSPCVPASCVSASVTVSPSVTTTYTVKLSSANGCTNTAQTIITVLTPTNAISVSGNTLICSGSSTTLTASGGSTYTWTPGGATTASIAVSPTVATSYTVRGTYSCAGTATTVVTVSVSPPPTLSISASSNSICVGSSVTLTGSGAISYTWNPGGLTSNSVVVSPTTTTTYTLIGLGAGGCTTTKTISISVNQLIHVALTPTLSTICAGTAVLLTASSTATTVTYGWNTGASTNTISVSPTLSSVYTVTITSTVTGCKAILSSTVNVIPSLSVTVNSATICSGTSATLTAAGASTYSWQPGGATTTSIVVSPTVTSNYTVIGTYSAGCTGTIVSTVNVIPTGAFSVASSVSNTYPVPGSTVALTSTVTPAGNYYTYNWAPGGITTASAVITPTDNANYVCTVSNQCGLTQTTSVCASLSSSLCSITSNSVFSTSTFSNTNITIVNKVITITGTITIAANSSIYLAGCTVKMGTNAKIIVDPTSYLTISTSKFFSCQAMWYGIEAQSNGSSAATIYIRGSSLEDAYNVIYANNSTTNLNNHIDVRSSTFNKNYIDVKLQDCANTNGAYNFVVGNSCNFISQSSSTSPGSSLKCSGFYSPSVKSRSYAGLYANNISRIDFILPSGTNGNTIIKNKDYGLYFDNTNATVNNTDFRDAEGIQDNNFGGLPSLPRGVGVYSKNSGYINIKPAITPTTGITTNFTNVGYGVITNNTYTVDVQNTSHTATTQVLTGNPITGIGITGTGLNAVYATDAKAVLRVNNNTFSQNYFPVTASYTSTPNSGVIMSIATNTITSTGSGIVTAGVTIQSAPALAFSTTADNMRVAANTFSNVEIGVKALSVSSGALRISNNSILLKTHASIRRVGVYLAGNNNGVVVDNNTISGGYTLTTGAAYSAVNVGVYAVNSPSCSIQCNTITQTGHGVEYNGGNSSPNKGFINNTLNYPMKRGLVLSNGGLIGTQGNSTGASANTWNSFVNITGVDQTFVGGPLPNSNPSNAGSSPLWVRNNATENPSDNNSTAPSAPADIFSTTLNSLNIITGTASYTACSSILTAGLKTSASSANASTTDRDADFVNYITNLLPATSAALTPQGKYMLKQYMFEALSQNPSTDATLVNFYNQQQSSSINTYYDIDSLLAAGNAALASAKNASASATNDITQTQQNFNALYLNGINNLSDLDNLNALANLCPQQYGNAVYQARALYQTITFTNKEYNDSCYTTKLNSRMGYDEEKENSVSVINGVQAKLYPNPNNGAFMLVYDLKKNNDAEVFIYDITGKIVFKSSLNNLENMKQINTSNLQNGIYFMQLIHDKSLLWTNKLVIQK